MEKGQWTLRLLGGGAFTTMSLATLWARVMTPPRCHAYLPHSLTHFAGALEGR